MKAASQTLSPGRLAAPFRLKLARARAQRLAARLWERDPALWKSDPAHQAVIANRLGWLDAPVAMLENLDEIKRFVRGVRHDLMNTVVLLGMGGSSLAPEVFSQFFHPNLFGQLEEDALELHVLDSTDPESILKLRRVLSLPRVLFLVSSKSGGTIETRTQCDYFWQECEAALGEEAGRHFAAITDAGSELEKLARERSFRHVFLNPPDIGGRYSALSLFGLVPAALLGIPLSPLLEDADAMLKACRHTDLAKNPALAMAVLLAVAAKHDMDKLTFLPSPALAPFVPWIEQLIAESTGKEGMGIIPVEGEAVGTMPEYGPDRVFVRMALASDDADDGAGLFEQARLRHEPCIEITLPTRIDLGGEFVRWEMCTAWLGALLSVNPFDEPNVKESKDATARILASFQHYVGEAEDDRRAQGEGFRLYAGEQTWAALEEENRLREETSRDAVHVLAGFLALVRSRDYLALLAYLDRNQQVEARLATLRALLRRRLGIPILRGYGPRFLHSIGQLYKGGPNSGLFIQITRDDAPDLGIPGRAYTFGQLKAAQALGDLEALSARGRRALRLHLEHEPMTTLDRLPVFFEEALELLGL
ncbi:glucose-6-phosphate isomerase [bacterium]|nr:glucose-6-phosphate isomerase [bacterium]